MRKIKKLICFKIYKNRKNKIFDNILLLEFVYFTNYNFFIFLYLVLILLIF